MCVPVRAQFLHYCLNCCLLQQLKWPKQPWWWLENMDNYQNHLRSSFNIKMFHSEISIQWVCGGPWQFWSGQASRMILLHITFAWLQNIEQILQVKSPLALWTILLARGGKEGRQVEGPQWWCIDWLTTLTFDSIERNYLWVTSCHWKIDLRLL